MSSRPQDGAELRANDLDRATACSALDNAYADGELDNDEYHRRLDAATHAKTRGALTALLGDLQVAPEFAPVAAQAVARPPARKRPGLGMVVGGVVLLVGAGVAAALLGGEHSNAGAGGTSTIAGSPPVSTVSQPDYTPSDAELLQHLPVGYDQSDCSHVDPQNDEVASLHCDSDYGRLEARFYLYPDTGSLQQAYDDDRQSPAHVACADGALDNAYAGGRYECILSNGSAVVPTVEWTADQQNILGVYFASSSKGTATVLNWWKQHNQVR